MQKQCEKNRCVVSENSVVIFSGKETAWKTKDTKPAPMSRKRAARRRLSARDARRLTKQAGRLTGCLPAFAAGAWNIKIREVCDGQAYAYIL